MAKKYLTLNIGAANVELAEYEAGAKGALKLVNYAIAPLGATLDSTNADSVLSSALLGMVRDQGIRPGPVAISVSGQMVFPRFAAIPMAGGAEKFEQLVRYEIEQNIPFPIDEMVCDRQIVGDTEAGDKSVMIVAAKLDQIEAITSAVAAAGFTPEIVDVAPIALTNVLAHARREERCTVILDIGAKTTSLVIVDGDKLYNRAIPVAGNTITREIASALGCSQEEAETIKLEKAYVSMGGVTEDEDEVVDRVSKVCRAVLTRLNAEISRSINFYRSQQGGNAPAVLYLTGGTALLPQIDQFFADSLGLEIQYFNALEQIEVSSRLDAAALEGEGAIIAATAGLALHAAGMARYGINLLPPALIEAKAEKAKIPFVAAAGLLLVGALALVMLSLNNTRAVIEAERDRVSQAVEVLSRFDKQVKTAEEAQVAVEVEAEALRKLLVSRSAAVQRLNAVRSSLAPGMWIEKWSDGKVTIRGWRDRLKTANGKTAGEIVVDNLKGKGVVDPASVKISDMSAVGKDGQVEQFTVELKFK